VALLYLLSYYWFLLLTLSETFWYPKNAMQHQDIYCVILVVTAYCSISLYEWTLENMLYTYLYIVNKLTKYFFSII